MSKFHTVSIKIVIPFFLGLILSQSLYCQKLAPNFTDFEIYNHKFDQKTLENQLKYLIKFDANNINHLKDYYQLSEDQFTLYSSNGENCVEETNINLISKSPTPLSYSPAVPRKNLEGVRIALDPGHLGGEHCEVEARYVNMNWKGKCIQFNEGDLTLFTARILKKLLKKQGADVLITREERHQGVYPVSWEEWFEKNKEPNKKYTEKELGDLFRSSYNPLDIAARAKLINSFHPDITLMIHYNAGNGGRAADQTNEPFNENRNIVFVPGAFMNGELKSPEDRYEFMRLLLSDDLEKSIKLSKAILEELTDHLHVEPRDGTSTNNTVIIEPGLEARNLALTRMVHGPLCYGETFYQDNPKVAKQLDKENVHFEELVGPRRALQVARAYYKGILKYFEEN